MTLARGRKAKGLYKRSKTKEMQCKRVCTSPHTSLAHRIAADALIRFL